MKEIRIHGRGGQGAVTTSEIIVYAAVQDGKFGACFPYFGFEKKGGPVSAFVRIDERKIREKNQVYNPNCIMVIDPTLLSSVDVFVGAKEDSILVINAKSIEDIEIPKNITKVAFIDANKASMDIFGKLLPNTIVLGAFVKATGWVSFDKVREKTREVWGPKNIQALEFGFENVTVLEVNGGNNDDKN
ncbi:2-oxoacid:acceptor oxidoreductase family protein [Youngiibacter fragilis]|uniref:Pyruvate/ketoisovalerate oxidoreductase subunit gamma n=1 Tax=Youngiibacter fragilis 232.1 TaxID=994573 RepID=V7I2J2_9CLOT|nr:2-oxoacid:acceptor oxidoreductase family protein [Youngiibacter fragilis]ETA79501.1 pyruvate/ketoisovalerate oxidoreductase subunit gamma [Youngiibacter fragilis 232.1]